MEEEDVGAASIAFSKGESEDSPYSFQQRYGDIYNRGVGLDESSRYGFEKAPGPPLAGFPTLRELGFFICGAKWFAGQGLTARRWSVEKQIVYEIDYVGDIDPGATVGVPCFRWVRYRSACKQPVYQVDHIPDIDSCISIGIPS